MLNSISMKTGLTTVYLWGRSKASIQIMPNNVGNLYYIILETNFQWNIICVSKNTLGYFSARSTIDKAPNFSEFQILLVCYTFRICWRLSRWIRIKLVGDLKFRCIERYDNRITKSRFPLPLFSEAVFFVLFFRIMFYFCKIWKLTLLSNIQLLFLILTKVQRRAHAHTRALKRNTMEIINFLLWPSSHLTHGTRRH